MALLSKRQETARDLARSINAMGAWVTSPMPLDDSARLRFQVLDSDRPRIIQTLSDWEWTPIFCSTYPRVCCNGMKLASVYEIDLPRERQVIVDDRQPIMGELASEAKRKTPDEVLKMRKHLGLAK